MTDRTLLAQALDALRQCEFTSPPAQRPIVKDAIAALRARLAQPDAEPIAYGMPRADGLILDVITPEEHESYSGEYTVPLYAAPPAAPAPAVPLTDAAAVSAAKDAEIAALRQYLDAAQRRGEELRAQVAALEVDAGRYKYLRDVAWQTGSLIFYAERYGPEDWDAHIDAALAARKGEA